MKGIQHLSIKAVEFANRRLILAENLLKKHFEKNHFIVLPSSDVQYKTHHIPRPFHQDTSLYYYTGFRERKSVLLMQVNSKDVKTTLFINSPSKEELLWDGPYPSKDMAKEISGIDYIENYNDFMPNITSSITNKESSMLWTINCVNSTSFSENISSISRLIKRNSLESLIDKQRVIKSHAEIDIMRQAAFIAGEALKSTFQFTKPIINEREILAKLFYEINIRGAKLAYPPVIAGGDRANIIHYMNSNQDIYDNELVLVDVGADVLGYYSDLTRTWPINGMYNRKQAILYDILETIQKDCVAACNPDLSLHDLYRLMIRQMGKYLTEEAIIKRTGDFSQFCPHHIGHYLGLDIHDTPTVSTMGNLLPGMVFPLEPGIYLSNNNDIINPEYRGIGMRLEDDFVMTDAGTVECLSSGLPRSRVEIENICNSSAKDEAFYHLMK